MWVHTPQPSWAICHSFGCKGKGFLMSHQPSRYPHVEHMYVHVRVHIPHLVSLLLYVYVHESFCCDSTSCLVYPGSQDPTILKDTLL